MKPSKLSNTMNLKEFTKYMRRKIDAFEQDWIINNPQDLKLDSEFEDWCVQYYKYQNLSHEQVFSEIADAEFTEKEAADYLGTSKYMVRLFAESGFIKKLQNGKYNLNNLREFMKTDRYKSIVGSND